MIEPLLRSTHPLRNGRPQVLIPIGRPARDDGEN
jgi:hypothetical protein